MPALTDFHQWVLRGLLHMERGVRLSEHDVNKVVRSSLHKIYLHYLYQIWFDLIHRHHFRSVLLIIINIIIISTYNKKNPDIILLSYLFILLLRETFALPAKTCFISIRFLDRCCRELHLRTRR